MPNAPDPLPVEVEFDIPARMRDGVVLFADLYRPRGEGRYPVLLQRTPYDKSDVGSKAMPLDAIRAASAGYAVLIQDVRGRHRSEGEFYPFSNETADGYDTVQWVASQSWSTGAVGMYGGSYVGATQWLAAVGAPPALKAIAPAITSDDYYEGWTYQGGAFQLNFCLSWTLGLALFNLEHLERRLGDLSTEREALIRALDHLEESARFLPTSAFPHLAREGLAPYYYDWLAHREDDEFWRAINISRRHPKVTLPAYNIGGWYDIFLGGTLRNYTGMRESGGSAAARDGQRLIIGPWMHASDPPAKTGDSDFGVMAAGKSIDLHGRLLRWFDHWLKGEANGVDEDPPIEIFVMGVNEWRREAAWPLARTRYVDYYLHSSGRAQSSLEDGKLSVEPPLAEPADTFLYDPRDPVPTRGGGLCCHAPQVAYGAFDQREVERRPDVLVYTSAPLEAALEITGPVTLTLWAVSSAPDTDFTAKLLDVHPCGRAVNLTDGIVRARYRRSTERAEPLTPGEVYEYHIDLWATSNVFLAGHRIRLEVSSSNFPRFDRNPNTGAEPRSEDEMKPALQSIVHSDRYPSRLTLPIIP